MAGPVDIVSGTKIRMAFENAPGEEPNFNMICTFKEALDESTFLVSIPMLDGEVLQIDEKRKLLFKYEHGEEMQLIEGYADDVVKSGIRRYWKIYRVAEQRQFIKRADERLKVSLPLEYYQETWRLNSDGKIDTARGETMDISNGGIALYLNGSFSVGDVLTFILPRIGDAANGTDSVNAVGFICWSREAPKGGPFKNIAGVQFRFSDPVDRQNLIDYVSVVKEKYKL